MTIYQIVDQYGQVRLEYLDKTRADSILDSVNAMSDTLVYHLNILTSKE